MLGLQFVVENNLFEPLLGHWRQMTRGLGRYDMWILN